MPGYAMTIATTLSAASPTYWLPGFLQPPLSNWVVISSTSAPWYVDALKAAFGSFFGATLAFAFAVLHRRMQERNAHLQAGNLALFKLRTIQRRTGELRLAMRHEIVEQRKHFADTPAWAILRPLMLTMDDIEVFDLDSLSFLLSSESGRDAVKHVKYAEELFVTLKFILGHHQDTAFEFQKATVDLRRTNPNASWQEIREQVGEELVSRRSSFFNSLLQRVEQDPAINRACFVKLEAALQERFCHRVWKLDIDFDPDSARAEPNLPPLPEDLKKIVAALPD